MLWRWRLAGLVGLLLLASCNRPAARPVEDLGGGQDVTRFALTSLKGTRNGDLLEVRAVYGDGARVINVYLRFRVTPPTQLASGAWSGLLLKGGVHERASTFLGGQSGPPSIGGSFDLLGPDGKPRYRVTIPLQPLNERL